MWRRLVGGCLVFGRRGAVLCFVDDEKDDGRESEKEFLVAP